MAYFNSDKAFLFPSAYRSRDSKGKYTSEENFIGIIMSIVDKDSYVLSTQQDINVGNPLRFVIHGYYFEIEPGTNGSGYQFSSSNTNPYVAYILVENKESYGAIVDIGNKTTTLDQNIDSTWKFKGLDIRSDGSAPTNNDTEHYTLYSLVLYNNGEIQNNIRLSTNSIYYNNNEQKNLTTKIDEKQDILSGNQSRYTVVDTSSNQIWLNSQGTTFFDSINNSSGDNVGSYEQPVSINDFKVKPITSKSGNTYTEYTSGSKTVYYTQAAVIKDGKLLHGDHGSGASADNSGPRFYYADHSPSNDWGNNGDIWFKYSA